MRRLADSKGRPVVRSEWNPELQRYSVFAKDGGGWRRILESKDGNEWTNLAAKPEFAAKKAELSRFLPKTDAPDIGDAPSRKAERKGERKKK